METEARQTLLAKVRQAQIRAKIPESSSGLPERLPYPALEIPELRARLCRELESLGVEVFTAESEEQVRGQVKDAIGGKTILAWDAEHLPYGLGASLAGEKVCFGHDAKSEQAQAEIGLTGCEAALAETGSLAMVSGPGRPRTASLLPYVHVAVIRGRDIVLGMGECLDKISAQKPMPYLVFITGPSRTADIELSLTLGVHGPGKVIAILGP